SIRGINRIVESSIKVSTERGGQMGADGKAKDTDAVRVYTPLARMRAHDPHGALRILQGSGRLWVRPRVGHAVFHKDAGDAGGVEPVAHLGPFQVNGQDAVTASRKDNHGGARVLVPWGV